jgi:hypothetical protein
LSGWHSLLFTINLKTKIKININFSFACIFIISFALKSILKLGPNSNMAGERNLDYLYSFREILTHPLTPLIGNLKTTWSWLWYLITPSTLLAAIYSFAEKKNIKKATLFLLLTLLPLISQV